MRFVLTTVALALASGFVLAQFLVLFYNHWYFADYAWLKMGLLTIPVALAFGYLQYSASRRIVFPMCLYWLACYAVAVWNAKSFDLRQLGFTDVLNYEAVVVWIPLGWTLGWYWLTHRTARLRASVRRRQTARELRLRRRLREIDTELHEAPPGDGGIGAGAVTAAVLILSALLVAPHTVHASDNPDDAEPARQYTDRHLETIDPAKRIIPPTPELPGMYPTPAALRPRETFWIKIENVKDGAITVYDVHGQSHVAGHVLGPVSNVNPQGFTASGWGEPGRITATSVNAIHIKVDHDYASGKGIIFSLTPIEFLDFDPKNYKSYFNGSSSLFTDIKAGTEIFGGKWAPLVGSRMYVRQVGSAVAAPGSQDRNGATLTDPGAGAETPDGLNWGGIDHIGLHDPDMRALPAPDGSGGVNPATPAYRPAVGDTLYFKVDRLKYNPEWLEFENRFGGIIWIKELGMDPYPIGQVLKPVVGCGRFLGTQYTGVGRIRANHPGVIDISTSNEGTIGGFQIIPRDHSMSSEMINARVKTQWMVIGPLYALDPSWEGLPPLFTDYLYPAWTPSDSTDPHAADTYLDRFTVRGRYSDDPDPTKYVLLHEAHGLNNQAFKTLTNIRIYFPRDSQL